VREAIDCQLEGEVRDTFYRDVLFHADLRPWLDDRDNQGALLWVAHTNGTGMYQPLDGKQRFRAQIGGLDPATEYDDNFYKDWIRASVGADEDFPIDIFSKLVWRVSARIADHFHDGRVFLAGDAAHVFTPTGGMGMNTAFAGVRNLAWKLAYVVKGYLSESVLETYESEWKPQATWRSAVALENHDYIVGVYRAYLSGQGLSDALSAFAQYTDYPGVIFGYELNSQLAQTDTAPKPQAEDPVRSHTPVVRSGRRLPHIWLDAAQTQSILDDCGTDYVLLLGPNAGEEWDRAVDGPGKLNVPVRIRRLEEHQVKSTPYKNEAAVLVRPDLIVVTHSTINDAVNAGEVLSTALNA